jgi:maltooligosyltrehalose trehalohydrolase
MRGMIAGTNGRMLAWQQPLGARPRPDGTTEFRVWAQRAAGLDSVAVRVRGADHELADEGLGVYAGVVAAGPGDDYWFVLDGEPFPDPCSRHQPDGLRGPSRVTRVERPRALGIPDDLVIYELHVGTFSPEGTFDGAIPYLDELARLGITAIEVMPIAEFPGRHGWGYDGVYLSAAHSAYGGPEGFARLVDAAHERGLAVLLDVVYNHVGASGGDALRAFGPYFTGRYSTFWGDAINFDDEWADPVREWILQSAEGWVEDFAVDGLRLDAIHAIYDTSAKHVLRELTERVHALANEVRDKGSTQSVLVIAESGLNDPRVIRSDGLGCDAVWADDFHHALRTLLTGERDGYYEEYGSVAQLARAFRRPVLHEGEWSSFRKRTFGAPHDDCAPGQFVVFCQNHDQVGNRALGDRLPDPVRPLAAFATLLSPFVPMLFMGEEYGERAPFQFFSDHIDAEIADATREGRRREFAAFAWDEVPDPQDPETFARSKLSRDGDPALAELYARLLEVRRELRGAASDVRFDEQARWLVVERGEHELAMNFAGEPRDVPAGRGELVLATHEAAAAGGSVRLPPFSGALLKR